MVTDCKKLEAAKKVLGVYHQRVFSRVAHKREDYDPFSIRELFVE
jgi:hypothetical protein